MKKLSLLSVILLGCFGGINAQENNMNIRHSVAQDVPMEVLASIESENPGLNIRQHLVAAVPLVKKVKRVNEISLETLQPYVALYKGRDYRKRELYTKEGNLIYSREQIKNVVLPLPVYKYIGRHYNGWLIKKNVAITIMDVSTATPRDITYYRVLLQDGKKKEWLRLDERGNVY